jgi:hypothetical protein
MGALGSAPAAFGAPFTYGTYISESFNDGGSAVGSFATPGGFNYDNGIVDQEKTLSDPAFPYSSVNAGAVITPVPGETFSSNDLVVSVSGGEDGSITSAMAEMWDTLTFLGVPSTLGPPILVGTLNMSGSAYNGGATGVNAFSAWGLDIEEPTSSFANAGVNCGLVSSYYACGVGWIAQLSSGVIEPGGNPSATFAPAVFNFSYPIYSDFLTDDQLSFIETIALTNYSSASLGIDPTITLTNLYPGVTVASASGATYTVSSVPEPATWAMMLLGVGMIGGGLRKARRMNDMALTAA